MSSGARSDALDARARAVEARLLHDRFDYFLGRLRDVTGQRFEVAEHHRRWADLVTTEERLVLLAPRDHGKSTLVLAHILWRFFRHAYAQAVGGPPGTYSVVLFSATHDQARVLIERFRDLLAANADLLGWVEQLLGPGREAESATHIRRRSGAELRARAWRTSTRGLHPDLIVLDDVLNDENVASDVQRTKTWRYFLDTVMPMHAARYLIVGTSLHMDDLLHRLAPRPVRSPDGTTHAPVLGFAWRRFPALLPESDGSLWPSRHSVDELLALRDADPTMFAREYQCDPRDDRGSMFPHALTQRAIDAGNQLLHLSGYRHPGGELVVLGADLALSDAAAADASVFLVVAWDAATGTRRLLTAHRARGMPLDEQVELIRSLCRQFQVDIAIIEDNGFQRWVIERLQRDPTLHRTSFHGHTTTARGKADVALGIPRILFALRSGLWIIPSGDEASLRFARLWQAELGAFGWRDGRLMGIGEHDDTVMATWFVELAVAHAESLLAMPAEEIVTMEDLGMTRVRIGAWDDGRW